MWDVLTGETVHKVWHSHDGGAEGGARAGIKNTRKVVSAVAWRKKGARGDGEWASAGADGQFHLL